MDSRGYLVRACSSGSATSRPQFATALSGSAAAVRRRSAIWTVAAFVASVFVIAGVRAFEPLPFPRLAPPKVGPATLHVLAPNWLELSRVTAKAPDPAPVTSWQFVDAEGQLRLPAPADFEVRVGDRLEPVARVGFKRRVRYAALGERDLRVGNWLYLELARPVASGNVVRVRFTDPRLGDSPREMIAAAAPDRLSPALHVNQEGYLPDLAKVAYVGAYLGTLGELEWPADSTFEIVECATGAVVFWGRLTSRPDQGFRSAAPLPYQQVRAADFSALDRPGQYRLRVPGLGVSPAFRIGEDVAALFARTYALGLYHQRCGTALALPDTRFTHGDCHRAPAAIPTVDQTFVASTLRSMTADWARNPRHTAPRLASIGTSLYPFVNAGEADVSGGHHDAGDYSKYTINSAGLIHHLVFAADAFPGVAELDNLGLPESGDGRSDVLQEARWEADFLVKMQDADGGFYFLVYPDHRPYELDATPDKGDAQVVFPKNTSATAAATAALAQLASSPRFRAEAPEAAARYLAAARRGWDFLQRAVVRFGRDGAYQKLSHYGDVFMHDDEMVWAAAELFAATGERMFEADLKAHLDPAASTVHRWNWWQAFEGYGCALRSYAFAARTGRLPASALDPRYLAQCEAELISAADDLHRWSQACAYGTSFPDPSKRAYAAGWYFSVARAFDLAAAYQLDPRPEWLAATVGHLDYEAGANPLNLCFVTGLGAERPSILVSQWALNDDRRLPPSGFPIGQLQTSFPWLDLYGAELRSLTVPSDDAPTAPYSLYDRWADAWNVSTEAVVVDQARGLATLAWLMARTPRRVQVWQPQPATIVVDPGPGSGEWTCSLQAGALDLSSATVVWETSEQALAGGPRMSVAVTRTGEQRVEAEAQLPDGRRVFAATRFVAACIPDPALPTVTVRASDALAVRDPADSGQFEIVRTGDATSPLTVAFALSGSARNGTDCFWIIRDRYDVQAGTVLMRAGVSRVTLDVIPRAGAGLKNAQLTVTLSPSSAYNVGLPHQATVEIRAGYEIRLETGSLPGTCGRGEPPFQFALDALPGRTFQVQTSSDLRHWTAAKTLTSSNEVLTLAEPIVSEAPCRWYRVVLLAAGD